MAVVIGLSTRQAFFLFAVLGMHSLVVLIKYFVFHVVDLLIRLAGKICL